MITLKSFSLKYAHVYKKLFRNVDILTELSSTKMYQNLFHHFGFNNNEMEILLGFFFVAVEHDPEESFEFCLTEAEKVKWLSEQQFEKALVGSNFEPPRLVVSVRIVEGTK